MRDFKTRGSLAKGKIKKKMNFFNSLSEESHKRTKLL